MKGAHDRDNSGNYRCTRFLPSRCDRLLSVSGALLLVFFAASGVVHSAEPAPRLQFVINTDAGIYREIQRKILTVMRAKLGADVAAAVINLARIKQQSTASHKPPTGIDAGNTLIVSIGTEAAYYAYKHFPQHRILSTLITYDGFQHTVEKLFGSEQAALNAGVSAVLLEQPIRRYFELGTTLVPDAKNIGVLLGPSSLRYAEEIDRIAEALDVSVELVKLTRVDNPIRGIQPVIKRVDYFVVLPDKRAFNRSVAKWVLQLSYRHRVPVIGYSKRYAEAGAIASVYSSADDIVREASRILLRQVRDASEPNTVHVAEEFSVQLNQSVAKAIGIILPEEASSRMRSGSETYRAAVQ